MSDIPESSSRHHRLARAVLAVGFVALGLWLAAAFLRALLWGVIVAIAIAPLYARAVARWPRRRHGLLPAAVTIGIALAVIVPVAAGVVEAAREAHQLTGWLAEARRDGIPAPDWVARLPVGSAAVAEWWQDTLATPDEATTALDRVNAAALAHSRPVGADVMRRMVAFAFALLTLFFLLARPRHRCPPDPPRRPPAVRRIGRTGRRTGAAVGPRHDQRAGAGRPRRGRGDDCRLSRRRGAAPAAAGCTDRGGGGDPARRRGRHRARRPAARCHRCGRGGGRGRRRRLGVRLHRRPQRSARH